MHLFNCNSNCYGEKQEGSLRIHVHRVLKGRRKERYEPRLSLKAALSAQMKIKQILKNDCVVRLTFFSNESMFKL